MFQQLHQHFEGRRDRVGAELRGLDKVQRRAGAGGEDFGFVAVVVVDRADVFDQRHAFLRDVVETADKRADIRRARLRGEQRLAGRETERHVRFDAFLGEDARRLQAFGDQRQLHDDVFVNARQRAPFAEHRLGFQRRDLRADRAVHDRGDFVQQLGERLAAGGDEAGVGRHAIDEAHRLGFLDFVEVAGVDKNFHAFARWLRAGEGERGPASGGGPEPKP